MDAAESTLVAGYRLDRYELLCPIASGGMASVWLARLRGKRGFEKLFAIKTIRTELISDPNFQEMFLDEARIASRIVHPNVAQILELGEQNDILYIVMEWVDGDSLAKVNRLALKRGSQPPPGVSMRIVADICAGLHAAHQLKDAKGESLGVVHRDVSPQNILLTTEGTAKVIDFGLVKARNRTAGPTASGVVKGKIRYMAPEQVGSKSIDHRADVWAAGMCLYELVVGHTPYHDEDDLDVVKRLMGPDPVPRFDAALPPQIEKVLLRALVRDAEGRFETCAAMKRAIETAIHELDLRAGIEEVADFVRETLPDLATKRAKTIASAIEAADARTEHSASLEGLGPGDMAFAATEVSRRARAESDESLPPTQKGGSGSGSGSGSDPNGAVSSYGASRTTGARSLKDQLGERRGRGSLGLWLAALVVVGAGGWILWPRATALPDTPAASAAPSDAAPLEEAATALEPMDAAVIEIEADVSEALANVDAEATPAIVERPTGRPFALPDTTADVAPTAPTYNPAWSILTNPPEAGLAPPPPSTPTPTPAPTPPASTD